MKDNGRSKDSRNEEQLLRGKPARDGAIDLVRIADPVGAELDLADAEDHVRGLVSPTIGRGREVVAGQILVELLPADEPFGVGQRDGQPFERAGAELVADETLACPQDRLASVQHADLRGQADEVRLALRLPEAVKHLGRALGAPEVCGVHLRAAVVVERLLLGADLAEQQVDARTVSCGPILNVGMEQSRQSELARDGEQSLHPVGDLELAVHVVVPLPRRFGVEAGQDAQQRLDLRVKVLGALIFGRVGPRRGDLLVDEAVGDRQVCDESSRSLLQFPCLLNDPLETVLIQPCGIETERYIAKDLSAFRAFGRDQCLRHRHHPFNCFCSA